MKTKFLMGALIGISSLGVAQTISYCTGNPCSISGSNNTAIGSNALFSNASGSWNLAFGTNALRLNTTGSTNMAIGPSAYFNSNGSANTGVGDNVGRSNTTGSNNTAIGQLAMFTNTTGNWNTLIGAQSDVGTGNLSNATAIGARARVMKSNNLILGKDSTYVGVGLSGDPAGPGNWLEINTWANTSVPGASGLRLRDLTKFSTPVNNKGQGVLSVDSLGDVIYVLNSSAGNYCGKTVSALTGNYQISSKNFDYNFTDDANPFSEKLQVGVACGNKLPGKFSAYTQQLSDPNDPGTSTTIYGYNYNPSRANFKTVGVHGRAFSQFQPNTDDKGVYGFAEGEGRSVGVFGDGGRGRSGKIEPGTWGSYGGYFQSIMYNGNNFGLYAQASQGQFNIGVNTFATPSSGAPAPNTYTLPAYYPTGANIGIYAAGDPNNSSSGTPGPDWAGWFDGDFMVNGQAYTTGMWNPSDRRYKKDITKIENAVEQLNKLNGYTYNYKSDDFKYKGFDNRQHIGFIAQELKEVYPQLVKEDAGGYMCVNYEGLIPVLVEAFKTQQKQIDELKAMLKASQGTGNTNSIGVELSDNNIVILDQNVPNPFADNTVITYNIPEKSSSAKIVFSNDQGNVIKVVDLTNKGAGSLQIFAKDLTHGVYSYALIIDGQVVSSKKMIRE